MCVGGGGELIVSISLLPCIIVVIVVIVVVVIVIITIIIIIICYILFLFECLVSWLEDSPCIYNQAAFDIGLSATERCFCR